jgi:ferritin-like metal-binding protein YciE
MQQTLLPNSRKILQNQLQEEKEQQSRLENLIANYGGKSTDAIADLPSLNSLTDAMKKKKGNALNGQDETADNKNDRITPQEIEILNTKEDALIKNAEILAYKNVLKVTDKIADKNVINILKQNLQEKNPLMLTLQCPNLKCLAK